MTLIPLRIGTAVIGMAAAAMLTSVAPANAREGACAPNALCALAPAPDPGDQGTAEQRVIDGYVTKQAGCTPGVAANPQGVTWDSPGFTPSVGGSGNINDANPSLGGHF